MKTRIQELRTNNKITQSELYTIHADSEKNITIPINIPEGDKNVLKLFLWNDRMISICKDFKIE